MKNLAKNSKGQGTPMLFLFTFLLCFLLWSFLYTWSQVIDSSQRRKAVYLCYRSMTEEMREVTGSLARTNKRIKTLFILKNSAGLALPKVRIAAGRLIALISLQQNFMFANYLRKVAKDDYCNIKQKTFYLALFPYAKAGLVLKRNFDQTAFLRRKKWKILFAESQSSAPFILTANYTLESRFQELSFSVKEVDLDFSSSKRFTSFSPFL